MGSCKMTSSEMENKNCIKKLIKNIFGKKDKQKERDKVEKCAKEPPKEEKKPLDTIVENFDKLHIEKKKDREENLSDEDDNFTVKVFEEERRSERTDSHSSQDSGFAQDDDCDEKDDVIEEESKNAKDDVTTKYEKTKSNEVKTNEKSENNTKDDEIKTNEKSEKTKDDEVTEALKNLNLEEKEKEKEGSEKKKLTLAVSRRPIKNKQNYLAHPYEIHDSNYRQISQINAKTFSGGQVIVNDSMNKPEFSPFNQIQETQVVTPDLQELNDCLAQRGVDLKGPKVDLAIIQEYIDEQINQPDDTDNLLKEFIDGEEAIQDLQTFVESQQLEEPESNAVQEFTEANHVFDYENFDTLLLEDNLYTNIYPTPDTDTSSPRNDTYNVSFPTPPRSENISSPESVFYTTHSEYSLSPNSDLEKCQEIPPFDDTFDEERTEKKRDRKESSSSMSMKQYKDLQKDIAASFSKKECCQANRKTCTEIFKEHLKKLKVEERRSLCLKVSTLDMKMVCGVLHHIIISLSQTDTQLDLQLSLFALICERIMAVQPTLFIGEQGLSLLKAASLRCYSRPLLTRYIVQCVRTALRIEPSTIAGRKWVFDEVDSRGDNLVLALVRAGDACADVLFEITEDVGEIPLFNPRHCNSEGYSALHVASRVHCALSPRLHALHVLLQHAKADLFAGDMKGGDLPLHLAVSSPTCDLRLVLTLFRAIDRKEWNKLAHAPNRSSVTPLELARNAVKSATRQNYPQEVFEFLKKCR